jgi:long-chain acyl-CoA synthetase
MAEYMSGHTVESLQLISDIVWRGVQQWGDRVALEQARDGGAITYRELYLRMQSGASALRARGFPARSRVLIQMDGSLEWAIAFLSVVHADLVAVPLPASTPAPIVAAVAGHAGAVAVLGASSGPDAIDLTRLQPDWCTLPQASPDDVAVLAFTSGSTARPHAVPLTHRNLLFNVRALGLVHPAAADETLLSVLPPAHLFELVVGQLAPLALGARIVYAGSPLPSRLLDAIRSRGVTRTLLVPALVESLVWLAIDDAFDRGVVDARCRRRSIVDFYRCFTTMTVADRTRLAGAVRERIGPTLRSVGVGGAALAPIWTDLLAGAGISTEVGYGLTEAGPLVSLGSTRDCPRGSVGRPLPGVQVCIGDSNEILVRSRGVAAAAIDAPEAPAPRDGWLHTGDIGWIDDDGYLFVTGRLKEAIVTAAGDTVYPDEIEPYYASALFAEWCVVPVPGPDGNDLAALVAVPASPALGADEFDRETAALRARAPARCRVAAAIRRDAPLPRTALGKIQRRALGAACQEAFGEAVTR